MNPLKNRSACYDTVSRKVRVFTIREILMKGCATPEGKFGGELCRMMRYVNAEPASRDVYLSSDLWSSMRSGWHSMWYPVKLSGAWPGDPGMRGGTPRRACQGGSSGVLTECRCYDRRLDVWAGLPFVPIVIGLSGKAVASINDLRGFFSRYRGEHLYSQSRFLPLLGAVQPAFGIEG
jgi:hypothetical protein